MVPEVVALARAMRAGGARVGTGEVEAAARALGVVGASREDAYLGLRAVMCSRREDLADLRRGLREVFAGADGGARRAAVRDAARASSWRCRASPTRGPSRRRGASPPTCARPRGATSSC